MSRHRASLIILLTMFLFRAPGFGASEEEGGRPGAFLDAGASAKSIGMGRAYTAVADDASAVYWNPSGLAQLDQRDVVVVYSSLDEGAQLGAFNYSQPTRSLGTFGLGLVSLRSGGYDKRSDSGDKLGEAETSETGFLLSQGYAMGSKWAFGSTLKFVQQKIDAFSGTGLGIDAGLMRAINSKWRMGMAVNNLVAPTLKLRNVGESYERVGRFGTQWLSSSKLTLAADLEKGQDRAARLNIGAQWTPTPLLAVRAGMNRSEMTAGVGVNMGDWNLDYAFGLSNGTGGVERLGPLHRFGLHISFGQTRAEMKWVAENLKYKPLAQKILTQLREKMANAPASFVYDTDALLAQAGETIRYGGFSNSRDLYEAQAYVFYFQKKYGDAVSYLSQAVTLGGETPEIKNNYQMILAEMNGEQKKAALNDELDKATDFYKKGEWKKAIESCRKILEIDPEHIEANEYIQAAQKQLNEPIERSLRIAKAKFERGEYLDVIKNLQIVRENNPDNQEAADLMVRTMDVLEKSALSMPQGIQEITRDSQKSRELFSKGLQYYSQGKLQEAMVSWKDAVRYDEANTSAQRAYERAALELGNRP